MKRLLLALSLSPLFAASAFAEPALVDQVERLDVERGELEIEWQSILADGADEMRTAVHILSGEYGVSERVSLGFELGAEDADGQPLEAEYILIQAKVVALDLEPHGFGLGAQASLGPSLNGGGGEAEVEFLGETRLGALSLAGDIALEAELDDFSERAVRYAVRADWNAAFGSIAMEAGGDLDPAPGDESRHWLGPVLALHAHDKFKIEMSYFAGLNDETPDGQLRLQLTLAPS